MSALTYRLVLVPVGDTATDEAAVRHGASLARATRATLAILGVIDTSAGFQFSAEGLARYDDARAVTQAAIEAASTVARGVGVARVEHLIMDGTPHAAIVEVAEEQDADLIVLGVARAILDGARSESAIVHILRRARCPVVIVPAERMAP